MLCPSLQPFCPKLSTMKDNRNLQNSLDEKCSSVLQSDSAILLPSVWLGYMGFVLCYHGYT